MISKLVRLFTSLKLTAVLLTLALVLVFLGTIAQVDYGLYQVQDRFFQSLFVFWAPGGGRLHIPVFPGGYLIGALMLINLVAVGITRLRPIKSKLGLLMVHSGLVLLLLGQLFTDVLSVESAMRLSEGETKNYSEDFHANELAIIDTSDPEADHVTSVSERLLRKVGDIPMGQTPLTARVEQHWLNADLLTKEVSGAVQSTASKGFGQGVWIVGKPAATKTDERNLPAAIVEIRAEETSLGSWLVSSLIAQPQPFSHGGRDYQIALRPKRHYTTFSLTLLECRHDVYKGTDIPRNFSSQVVLDNPETGENREVLIWMNNPLRYGGNTYYQYQMAAATGSSTLQVVRNPSWLTPYISCTLIGLGLVWQFMSHLFGFLHRRPHET
jgi:hypothetical protein